MGFRRREHGPSPEAELTEKIFKEALALAEAYNHPHHIWRAMDNLGIKGMGERRRLKPLVQDRIDVYHDQSQEPVDRPSYWRPKDIFNEEGRAWLIEEARKHLLEYPGPEEFERDWDAA